MFLQRLKTRNFRLLEDFELVFDPQVRLLIGPNNAGKSNVVDALLLIKEGINEVVGNALGRRGGFGRIVSRHQTDNKVVIELVFSERDQEAASYSVVLSNPEGLVEERIDFTAHHHRASRAGGTMHYEYDGASQGSVGKTDYTLIEPVRLRQTPELVPVVNLLANIVHVDPFRKVEREYQVSPKSMIDAGGADLAQVLHYHYSNDPVRFEKYKQILMKVAPEVELIGSPILSSSNVTVSLGFRGDSNLYNLWQISSGLKDILVLLAAIHFSTPGSLVIVEEPENHLHPAAQKALSIVIREAAASEAKQFILTTHSETILGQFGAEKSIWIDKDGLRARAIPLASAEPYQIWERLGIERNLILQVLGKAQQVLAILEGRDDYETLEPLWEHFEIQDKVLARTAGGGGWKDIVDSAADLRDSLGKFKLGTVFVLLDNDSKREEKLDYLRAKGFSEETSHVWFEKEIESYLALPPALASISTRSVEEVADIIGKATGGGKQRLERILRELGIPRTPYRLIVKHALANDPAEIAAEVKEVPNKIRGMLGLPRLST